MKIGHRGASAYAPENTCDSLRLAINMDVDMVEFDVRRCKDNGLVLIHDEDLRRSTGVKGKVRERTLVELKDLKVRAPHLPDDLPSKWVAIIKAVNGKEERIPTLQEAIELIKGYERRTLMNIDLKETGYEESVLQVIAQYGVENEVLISSLKPQSLCRIKGLNPSVKTGISYPEDKWNVSRKRCFAPIVETTVLLLKLTMPLRIMELFSRSKADAAMLYYKVITPKLVEMIHRNGYKVYAWTIDSVKNFRRIRRMGVDGISSNRPDLLEVDQKVREELINNDKRVRT